MRKLALWAAVFFAPLVAAAQPAFADAAPLQMTQEQMLTPADFTSVEAKFYATLDPAGQKNFIATRSFVRISQRVVDELLPAAQLPDRPAGFSVKYLLRGDAFDINNALADYLAATEGGGEGNLVPTMTAEQSLQPSDLTPAELTYFKTLDAAAAKHFMATRSYVRLCQQVLDQKLPAYRLPKQPAGTRGEYLIAGEAEKISKAEDASLQDLLQRYPDAAKRLLGSH